ncbi:MAG: flagellar hook-basal body complex protein FliE [Treponema sp.]|nr:flagellar hook-basal body complex protein FliE [Treponema sp.]
MQPLQMIRTNPAHVGISPIQNLTSVQTKDTVKSTSGVANKTTFQDYLINAVNYVNGKQVRQTDIANQLIIDPDSVDVHDVTTAMAEAQMSLDLAQTLIDRIIKGWNEITTTR